MLCKNCGEYFNTNAKFCPVCGTPLFGVNEHERQDQNVTISAEKTVEGQPEAVPPRPLFRSTPENSGAGNMPPNGPFIGVQGTVSQNNGFTPPGGKDGVNKTLVILICMLGTLLICGALFFFFYNQKNSDDEQPVETTSSNGAQVETTQTNEHIANTINVVTQPATEPDDKVKVPNVTGVKFEDAVKYLEAAGLEYEFELVPDDSVQPDYVISQSPQADSSVEKGSNVLIKVSKPSELPTQSTTQKQTSDDGGNTYYVIAKEYVTLRDAATRTGREITKVSRGEKVTYIYTDGEFFYVSYNGMKGYILSEFLSKNKNDLNSGTGNAPLKTGDYLYCHAVEFATLRSTASTSASALAKISRDERVNYLGDYGTSWFYVLYNGKKGYVLKSYFSPRADDPINYSEYY